MFGYFSTSSVWIAFLSMALLMISITAQADPPVKQSSSGLCHSEESPYYDRTKTLTGYESLEECVLSGGQLRDGRLLAQHSESYLKYERSHFGHGWDDSDGDCQNSRAEALIAQSSTKVRFADERRCRVITGRWISPFTGNIIQNASEIDIDHVVPLKWAWDHGADMWSGTKRERFYTMSERLECKVTRSQSLSVTYRFYPSKRSNH